MTCNRIKGPQGEIWLTVPVWKTGKGKQMIRDVTICNETDWRRKHLRSIRQSDAHAPYLHDHLRGLEAICARGHRRLLDLNSELICYFREAMGLAGRPSLLSELGVTGQGSALLVSICRSPGADRYVTLPTVEKYLDPQAFCAAGIALQFARYHPPVYPQRWREFRANLSVLDLLLNCGPKSTDIVSQD